MIKVELQKFAARLAAAAGYQFRPMLFDVQSILHFYACSMQYQFPIHLIRGRRPIFPRTAYTVPTSGCEL